MICPSRSCRKKYLIRADTTDCTQLSGNDPTKLNRCGQQFSPFHLFTSTLCSVPARIMTCQCLRSSAISVVIWFLALSSFTRSYHLSFGIPRFRFPSTVIFPLAHRSMRISVVCNFLSSFFPTDQHPSPYTINSRLVHFVFQLCWYVSVAHHPGSFPPVWPGNLYSVVYIFLGSSIAIEHWAQILERFHCLYLFCLNVDSWSFSGHGIYSVFPLLTLSPWDSNVSLHLSSCNSTSGLLCS